MRRAITVVEMLVGVLLASLVIGLVWRFFSLEQRRFGVDQARLVGLQGSLQLDEALAWDLERIALDLPDGGLTYTLNDPVKITDARQLEFAIFDGTAQAGAARVTPVTYLHDPATGRVLRRAGDRERSFSGLVAQDLEFSLVKLKTGDAGGAFTYGSKNTLHLVKYIVSCLPDVTREPSETTPQRVTLVGAVAIPYRSDRCFHPYWRPSGVDLLGSAP